MIQTGKLLLLSPQQILSCNFIAEGCAGGWPLTNGIFAHSFPLVGEKCAPYQASTLKTKCSDYSHCQERVEIVDFYQIGGYYGGASELAMMLEIRSKGPISADFKTPLGFAFYDGGIFSDDHVTELKN